LQIFHANPRKIDKARIVMTRPNKIRCVTGAPMFRF
jgi:hypothetical protein